MEQEQRIKYLLDLFSLVQDEDESVREEIYNELKKELITEDNRLEHEVIREVSVPFSKEASLFTHNDVYNIIGPARVLIVKE